MRAPERSSGAELTLRNLTKRFGNARPAVDQIDLEIHSGEFMTLLGPSGSGKTTTLNMIAGLEDVTSGEIRIDGENIAALPPYRRNLGMVFQQYALFPHMTAAENVAFPLQQRKVQKSEIADRVRRALALVRLDDLGDRKPQQLSGGQQQRVALARAIVFNPQVLLMDEPLGALDKKLREQLQGEIARLHRELGITIVFVTHDQEEALALSDRIAVFDEGKIDQVGSADELYERPGSRFVATFLGDSNIFSGTLRAGVLQSGDSTLRVPDGHSLPDGTPACLVVRPERTRIVPGNPGPDENTLSAEVTAIVYQGAFRKVNVRLPDGVEGSVREGVEALTAVDVGEQVRVCWSPDNAVLLAHDTTREPARQPVP